MTTNIAWVNRPGTKGETWNPVTGCTPCSPGCLNCYAATMAGTRLQHHDRYRGLTVCENGRHRYTGEVRLNHDRLDVPLHWRNPRTVFVCSMSDLFHPKVRGAFLDDVWYRMGRTPQHTYQILTKRADMMAAAFEYGVMRELPNVWLGTTVENQAMADERIPHLLKCPAPVRFLSCEPLLERLDLRLDGAWCPKCKASRETHAGEWSFYVCNVCNTHSDSVGVRNRIHQVIVGAETGPNARPMEFEWALDIQRQCRAAGIPFFFKQGPRGVPVPPELDVREWPK